MTLNDIVCHRLINQQIVKTKFKRPEEIVSWLGAMQAQDFAMAKWAIGLRLPGWNDSDIENAFNSGTILRTHILRPTWHFVTSADIRWMVALTAPHVNAFNAFMYRKLELDEKIFKRSNAAFAKTLKGGRQLTRAALNDELRRIKISADGLRMGYLLMRAELDGIICSGVRQGKQFTYALLDERAPRANKMKREEALEELTKRYFTSRGPATVKDFGWWSGLPMKDARAGLEMVKDQFHHETIEGEEYIFSSGTFKKIPAIFRDNHVQTTFLMPDYDEYGISYKDRSPICMRLPHAGDKKDNSTLSYHALVIDGVIAGRWQRTIKNKSVHIKATPYASLNRAKQQAVINAVKKYHSFLSSPLRSKG